LQSSEDDLDLECTITGSDETKLVCDDGDDTTATFAKQ
jgi:hypothetical protein